MGSFCMGLRVGGGNEEVVHVDDEPSFSNHVLEGVIHESLECSGRVAETKEHDSRFKESFVSNEGHFLLMTVFDVDIIVPPMNVEFGEVVSDFQLVDKVGDERKGVVIVGGVFIKVLVVLTGAKFAILLFDKEEGRCLGGAGRMNLPSH